jgi:hypothetical protein
VTACRWQGRALARCALAACAPLLLAACSPQQLLVRRLADELAAPALSSEDDVGLARDAAAFYLKLSESVLRQDPSHLPLAAAVAGGFTQYAYAFVATDAERLEARDVRAAQHQRERAARLYRRARDHAITALQQRHPPLLKALAAPAGAASGPVLAADEVPAAYWAAAAWGAAISLSKDQPDAVADLPSVVRLAALAYAIDPAYGQGDLASLMGTLEAARPGGDARRAQDYFDRAAAAAGGRSAGVLVAMAESLALPAGDRPRFESLLREAIAIGNARRNLANEVMRERAQWLLDSADDRF